MTETEPTPPRGLTEKLKRILGRFAGEERIITNADGSKTVGNLTVNPEATKAFTPEGLRLISAFYSEESVPVSLKSWDGSDEQPPSR